MREEGKTEDAWPLASTCTDPQHPHHIQTKPRFYLTLVRMPRNQQHMLVKMWGCNGHHKDAYTLLMRLYSHYRNQHGGLSKKLKLVSPKDLAIPFLGTHPKQPESA